jgi:hypothetical protein
VKVKGKGGLLGMPDVGALTGTLDVQLQPAGGGPCFGATYSPPFKKNDGVTLLALSDAPPVTTTSTSSTTSTSIDDAAARAALVRDPQPGDRRALRRLPGGPGGLSGLNDCNTAHAMLVNVASTELPTMDRVEPGDRRTAGSCRSSTARRAGSPRSARSTSAARRCRSRRRPHAGDARRDPPVDHDGALNDCP